MRFITLASALALASFVVGGSIDVPRSAAAHRRMATTLRVRHPAPVEQAMASKSEALVRGAMTDPTFGLNPKNLHHSGIAVGFLPGFGEAKGPNTPQQINAKLPAPMAVMGDYATLDPTDPSISTLDYHISALQSLAGKPVYSVALMPSKGLNSVTQTVANNIAAKMLALNNKGITVWLRFAHEMNGDWYAWGQQPALFIEKWQMVSRAVKAKTTKTYMVWSPNSMFGNTVNDVRGGWTPYWPGAGYVDIVGLSFYHYGGYQRLNIVPTANEAINMLQSFSKLYGPGSSQNKKITLSETGASYTYDLASGKPGPGGASEYDIKTQWLKQLLDPSMAKAVPGLMSISWFEIVKDENAAGNSTVKEEDFRLLLGNSKVSSFAQKYLKSG